MAGSKGLACATLQSKRMPTKIPVLGFTLALALAGPSHSNAINWTKIDAALGKTASVQGMSTATASRSDLQMQLDGVTIKPALALEGWLAFEGWPIDALVMGDLVLCRDRGQTRSWRSRLRAASTSPRFTITCCAPTHPPSTCTFMGMAILSPWQQPSVLRSRKGRRFRRTRGARAPGCTDRPRHCKSRARRSFCAPPERASISRAGLVKDFGPHHCAINSNSVHARNTRSGSAAKVRAMTTSRLAVAARALRLSDMALPPLRGLGEIGGELIEGAPEATLHRAEH
jgi:Domain of Unknown Function (DUF1259)